jgi:histidinol dehydrogenase
VTDVVSADNAALSGLLDAGWNPPAAIVADVTSIIEQVRTRGDEAIVEYTRRFDDGDYTAAMLRVPIRMVDGTRSLLSKEIVDALELAKDRITRFHRRQRQPDIVYAEEDGSRYALARRPLRSVAVYAHRSGPAIAVLMGAVPAKLAGVARVIVLSPPHDEGLPNAVLFASALCGVDELYAIGGAQAIAAAACGTSSVAKVDKIVGRGGLWTTEAKRQVFGRCGIDSLAGPAEVLVVADDGANSEFVVGELLAQAERRGATRLAVLSESRALLEAVAQLIDTLDLQTAERSGAVSAAMLQHCRLIAVQSREELFDTLNRFAPAYLCLQVRDATAYLEQVTCAGAVFVGDMTPGTSGEYLAGTNHAVPTGGTARFSSCLSLADFTRTVSVVENSRERSAADGPALASLAEFDRLPHHAQTARMRYGS